MRVSTAALGTWLLCAALAAPAWARPESKSAAKLIKDAERLYQAGKYHDAAEELLKAQELEPNPRLVYNIARAFDQAGELDSALTYYQQYVGSSTGTDPTLLKRSALSIDRIRGLLKQRDEQRARTDAERQAQDQQLKLAQQHAEEETAAKRRAEEDRRTAMVMARQSYERSRTEAFVAGGAAIVGAAVGITFGVLALSSKSQFANAGDVTTKAKLASQTQTQALVADIGYGVAIAAAVTAIVLYPKGAPPTAIALSLGPTGAGVEVRF